MDNVLIAIVSANAPTTQVAVSKALRELEEAITFMNFALEADGFLSRKEYIYFDENKTDKFFCFSLVRRNFFFEPTATQVDKLNLNLIFKDKLENPAVQQILSSEKLFLSVMNTKTIEEQIMSSWTFLDSFIDFGYATLREILGYGKNCSKIGGELISELFAKILLTGEIKHVKSCLHFFIHNVIINSRFAGGEWINISQEIYDELIKHGTHKLVDINSLRKIVKHDFFKEKIKAYDTYGKSSHLKTAYDYYSGILFELYENRNMLSHSGKSLSISVIKLSYVLPQLIERIKKIIVEELMKRNWDTTKDLLTSLIKEKGNN